MESEVPPLEGRIFYNYPGQTQPSIQGTLASPSVVARVVKDFGQEPYPITDTIFRVDRDGVRPATADERRGR